MSMYCWKCGAQVAGSACLACGCLQSSRQAAESPVGEALRYAYDKFGARQILTDRTTLRRCLSDLLPDEKKLRGQIAAVMETDAGQRLFDLMQNNGTVDLDGFQGLARGIQEDCGLDAPRAEEVLGYLLEMIGCGDPRRAAPPPAPPPPPQDDAASFPGPPEAPGYDAPPGYDGYPPYPPAPDGYDMPPPPQDGYPVQILAQLKGVLIEDATRGVGGWAKGKRGEFFVRSDGVSLHFYHGFRGKNPSIDPDFFIPREAIVQVNENFFLGTYAFTIVTEDGRRFRATASGPKEKVLNALDAIRYLIS